VPSETRAAGPNDRSSTRLLPRVILTSSPPAAAGRTLAAIAKRVPRAPLPTSLVRSRGTIATGSAALEAIAVRAVRAVGRASLTCTENFPSARARSCRRRPGASIVTARPRSAGITRPRNVAGRRYRARAGPVSVMPCDVTRAVCVAASPEAEVAVSVAVQRPAAYVWATVRPSAAVPSPKSQWNAAASPVAEKVTASGAAPSLAVTWIPTSGGAAEAA
jgi:hypothetical protein